MKRSEKFIKSVPRLIFSAFLWLYAAVSLYPLIWMLFYSLKDNAEIFVTNPFGPPKVFRWENYANAWTKYDVPSYFMNSVVVAAGTAAITIFVALLFTYATARMKWRGQNLAHTYVGMGTTLSTPPTWIPRISRRMATRSESWR